MEKTRILFGGVLLAALFVVPAWAQRPRFSQPLTPGEPPYQGSGVAEPPSLTPVPGANSAIAPGASLGAPQMDPYGPSGQSPPSLLAPDSTPYYDYGGDAPLSVEGATPLPTDPFAAPGYPSSQPGYVFPNGVNSGWAPSSLLGHPQPGPYLRLFQDVRFRHTWITGGDDNRDLQIHDSEIATTLNYPNFLFSNQPLQVSPGFILHLWDGPKRIAADLPPHAYSAYLNFGWQPEITPTIGAILNVRIGAFSDFNTFTDDSIRILGQGLAVVRLTPTIAIKGGVEYFDRVDIKFLPAGGILWTPNPCTRWDIYFPRPKLASQFFVVGNKTVWWYVGGELGGGSWTIERANTMTDQVDINDLRVFAGLEWVDHFGLAGFIEAGYVFNRKLVYRFNPQDNVGLDDAFMLRAGFSL